MIAPCAAYLVALFLFLLIYFGIYRPLFSCPYPGEIGDLIAAVQNVRFAELDRLLSEEMSDLMSRSLSPRDQRKARRRLRHAISIRMAAIEADVHLCLAFTRHEVLALRRKAPGPRTERDRLLEDVFEKAQSCSLVLAFAKANRVFLPWDQQRLLKFHRETVMEEVRELVRGFVKLSATYGEHRCENLIVALDAWDVIEDSL